MKKIITIIGNHFYQYQLVIFSLLLILRLNIFFESFYLKLFLDEFATSKLSSLPVFVIFTISRIAISFLLIVAIIFINKKIYEVLSGFLVSKFLQSKWSNVYKKNHSDTQHLINNDVNAVLPLLLDFYPVLIIDLLSIIAFVAYLGSLSIFILPVVFISMLATSLISSRINTTLKAESIDQRKLFVQKNNYLSMIHNKFSFIFANRVAQKIQTHFDTINSDFNRVSLNVSFHSDLLEFTHASGLILTNLLAILILVFLDSSSVGAVVQTTVLISNVLNYNSSFWAKISRLNVKKGSINRIEAFLDEAIAVQKTNKNIGEIYVKIGTGSTQTIKFQKNKINIICGSNGSGKTTILNKLFGLDHDYPPNVCVTDSSETEVILGDAFYVTNYPFIENGPLENIANVNKYSSNISYEEIQDIISKTGLSINTIIENDGENLSLGQKQLVHLISALTKKYSVFVFDEPDSAINKEIREWFYALMSILVNQHDVTIIIVSHNFKHSDALDQANNYNFVDIG